MTSDQDRGWEQFKRDHPPGSEVKGMDSHVAPYGAYVDLGVPYLAVLLVSYLAPVDKAPKSFPEDYPKVGDTITALVRHYGDPILPGDVGKIALTQDPHSIGTATTR